MPRSLILVPLLSLIVGCNIEVTQKSPDAAKHGSQAAAPTAPQSATSAVPGSGAPAAPAVATINGATPDAVSPVPAAPASGDAANRGAAAAPPISPFVIRAEVLLARAHFSPGVVDGKVGTNLKHAVAAYQKTRDLPASGDLDDKTWLALTAEPTAARPAAHSYTITPADVAGPFAANVGENFVKLAALPNGPQFSSPVEALASQTAKPGKVQGEVTRIDVAKADASVRAFDQAGDLIAFYPATVGSTERPSPSGTHKVVGVAWKPDYTYDPAKLHWGPRSAGKLVISPGPKNPVGLVWIDLNAPGYGLHGTPDPDNIGKTASHGCVRLTNWDALNLAGGVKPGVVVRFIGQRGGAKG